MRIASHRRPRRGAITLAWFVFWGILFFILLWSSQLIAFRSHAKVELQDGLDAAAHAAARTLVTESVFTLDYCSGTSIVPIDRNALISQARANAIRLASINRFMGKPIILSDNPSNSTDGELYFTTLDDPAARTNINPCATGFDPYHPDLNAVRCKAHRSRVGSSSTYFIDRDVVGFRLKQPPKSSPAYPFIPMVPIAILSQPCPPTQNNPACWSGKDHNTWEQQIMARGGVDHWSMDSSGQPVSGIADGIKEITVTLTEGGNSSDNGQLVYFNSLSPSFSTLVSQVTNGIVYGDLPANDGTNEVSAQQAGQFLLNYGSQTLNQASAATAPLGNGEAVSLQGSNTENPSGLLGILGQPRIWLLYSQVPGTGTNRVNVVGFVVARVMSAQVTGASLTIILQPSVLVIDEKAVTDWTLRNNGPRSLYNPYIARLRFVE
jgi:hypothetical protein